MSRVVATSCQPPKTFQHGTLHGRRAAEDRLLLQSSLALPLDALRGGLACSLKKLGDRRVEPWVLNSKAGVETQNT